MNWLPIVINFLLAIHVLVSLLIVLLVLMQRPKNEGLGAAFGGGMTENLFGAQTTNVLQTATRYLGGLFFALTLLLSWLYVKKSTGGGSELQQRLRATTVVPATPAPTPPAAGDSLPGAPLSIGTGVEAATDPVLPTPALAAPVEGALPPPAATPAPAAPATPAPAVESATPPAAAPEAAKPAPAETPAAAPAPAEVPAN